jgi:hypothetical protein
VIAADFLSGAAELAIVILGAVAAVVFYRGGGTAALSQLETANRVLERRVHELELLHEADQRAITELQASRDFAEAMKPLHAEVLQQGRTSAKLGRDTLELLGRIAAHLDQTGVNGA